MSDDPSVPRAPDKDTQEQLDDALDDTFPASDPVSVGGSRDRAARIERDKREQAAGTRPPKPATDEEALPVEKPM